MSTWAVSAGPLAGTLSVCVGLDHASPLPIPADAADAGLGRESRRPFCVVLCVLCADVESPETTTADAGCVFSASFQVLHSVKGAGDDGLKCALTHLRWWAD